MAMRMPISPRRAWPRASRIDAMFAQTVSSRLSTATDMSCRMGFTSGWRRALASVLTLTPRVSLGTGSRSERACSISGSAAFSCPWMAAVVMPGAMRAMTVPDCSASRSVQRGAGSMRPIIPSGSQTSPPTANPLKPRGMIPTTVIGVPFTRTMLPTMAASPPYAVRQRRSEMMPTVVGTLASSSSAPNSRPDCGRIESVVNRVRVIASMRTGRSSSPARTMPSTDVANPRSSNPRIVDLSTS